MQISIHALREEGDPETLTAAQAEIDISIHALREEGDVTGNGEEGELTVFLSTPSARRATPHLPHQPPDERTFLSTPSARRATFR